MEQKNSEFNSMKIISAIFRFKYFIIIFTILVTAAMAAYWFSQPNWYKSTVNLVPPKASGSAFESMMGNISSTLRNFGITKIGPKTDNSYSLNVILVSRTVKDSIIRKYNLRKIYQMEKAKAEELRAAFDENLDITVEMDGNYTISISDTDPVRASVMTNDYVDIANQLSMDIAKREASYNRNYLETRIKAIDSALAQTSDSLSKYSSKYQIYQPEEQATSIGKALIDIKSEIIKQEINLELMRVTYGENDPLTKVQERIIAELKNKLSSAENEPGFAGKFSMNQATGVGIEYMRLYSDYETAAKVKAYLGPILEEQKINEYRDTKAFLVLDKAIPPDKKDRPKRSVYIAGAFFGSIVLSVMFVVISVQINDFRKKYKNYLISGKV